MTDQEHSISPSEVERPPDPPPVHRGFRLYWYQWAGLPLVLGVVVLAVAGVFGESRDTEAAASELLALRIDYPTRFRYKQIEPMEVRITNRSPAVLDTVTVSFDTSYIHGFSNVTFTPSATRAYAVELPTVRPGETRLVRVQYQAEQYWRHTGRVVASAAGADSVGLIVSTLVFP